MPYIYKISNNLNEKLYIGKTSKSIKKRFKEHCKDSSKFSKRPLYADMVKYGFQNFKIELIEFCENEELANEREQFWIQYFQAYYNGYNSTHGGYGKRIYDYELIYKEWLNDRNCSATAMRLGISPETVSLAVKKHNEIPYCKNNLTVDMLDLQGNYIRSFNSIREAAKFMISKKNKNTSNGGGYSSHISSVCRGNRKTCFGYKWRYSE